MQSIRPSKRSFSKEEWYAVGIVLSDYRTLGVTDDTISHVLGICLDHFRGVLYLFF